MPNTIDQGLSPARRRLSAALKCLLALLLPLIAVIVQPDVARADVGDTVWIGGTGKRVGHPGSAMYAVYDSQASAGGTPTYWAYCLEHDADAELDTSAVVGDFSDFLGGSSYEIANADPARAAAAQAKIQWVLAHGYPALTIEQFRAASGVSSISVDDAVEATQYAIWRYANWDATSQNDRSWQFENNDSKNAYYYYINSINTILKNGGSLAPAAITASISAPVAPQTANSLVGPFVVHTNQATASITASPNFPLVDSGGTAINADAVVDGQQVYVDRRGDLSAGSVTLTLTAQGSGGVGKVISVPTTNGGTPTKANHAQSMILVVPSTQQATGRAGVNWIAVPPPPPAPQPSIGTSLVDKSDNDRILDSQGGTLVDTVAYQNLTPGKTYTVAGELIDKATSQPTGITAQTTFSATEPNGTVDVVFTVPAGYAGKTLVAFETLYSGSALPGNQITDHKDINDTKQTVTVSPAPPAPPAPQPSIGTSLVDRRDGDRVVYFQGGSLADTVAYQNLTPGKTYTLTGELIDKATVQPTGITGSVTFTPEQANGTVEVYFEVPEGYADKTLVAFETLYEGSSTTGNPVAEHKDVNDAKQTVTVAKSPVLGTSLVDKADNDRTLDAKGGILVDTVAYQHLTPNKRYTMLGELIDKATGESTGITGSVIFSATAADGTVDVSFEVPEGYAGKTLVAYERLFDGPMIGSTAPLAEHTDLNDAQQTVTVSPSQGELPRTLSQPKLTTQTSEQTVTPGARLFDKVRITGFVAGHGARGKATLYGPFATRADAVCTPAHAVKTVRFTPRNGVVQTPKVKVRKTGYYTWVAKTTADSRNRAATHACGMASETTLVRKAPYRSPVVSTGFSSPGDLSARLLPTTVGIPAIGVRAFSSMVGIEHGRMQIPGNVARVGQLDRSAALGDLIGTTVIAGHVSDRADRPGAFWKLARAKKSQIVKVTVGGKTIRYQVTAVEKFSRTKRLPQRLFSTTGAHRLVLISCADRVTTPGGGFHYKSTVAVTARRLKG